MKNKKCDTTIKDDKIAMPKNCGSCEHSAEYGGRFFNHHWCCELIWELSKVDYKVDPKEIDSLCPLKNENLRAGIAEFKEGLYKWMSLRGFING